MWQMAVHITDFGPAASELLILYENDSATPGGDPTSIMNKSVENVSTSSHDSITSNNLSLTNANLTIGVSGNDGSASNLIDTNLGGGSGCNSPSPSPTPSPWPSPRPYTKRDHSRPHSDVANFVNKDISPSKLEDQQNQEAVNRSSDSAEPGRNSAYEVRKETRAGDRTKKKSSWYNVLYPTYKSRSEDFKRIFKDVPDDERLVVDYSCALQRDILVHGRLYVSQNYICFYANIFSWETSVSLRWKDVASITKEKTALVIPNAILVCTETDKFFLTSFGARDKAYLMLFRVWQNALIGQPMSMTEMWQLVHACYGDELGLTSDDEDYVPSLLPAQEDKKISIQLSVESYSEAEGGAVVNSDNLLMPPQPNNSSNPELDRRSSTRPESHLDPTDLSDTTESEAEKHPLRIALRSNAVCSAVHDGRQLCNATLPIHIDQLFTLLFTNSKFFLDFHTARKTTDLVQSAWTQDSQTGQKSRTVSLTISLSQSVGPKSSQVTETQIMLPCSRPGHLYCIDIESNNAGIPYADSFSVHTHYCMTSSTEGETNLAVFSQIKYKKNVWGLVKSFIEKNCWAGLEEYFGSLVKALSVESEEGNVGVGLKRKARRRRRLTGAGASLQAHPTDHLQSCHQAVTADLPRVYNNNVSGVRNDTSNIVSWILLLAVLCLMLINGLLYYKLWGLEEAAAYTIMDLHVLKNTPKTEEDWINLLQQQESLHNVEMRKWQRVLHTAAQLLRQTEESLTELQMSIHPTVTDNVISVLKTLSSSKSSESRSDHQSYEM
ncbi:protein Aster-B isoform X1 [Neodiprion pinetum]|uniref:GRAM domain-containing protein 1B-like isoform X1 n=1 Tax=Neodiprion lecontei TaxID=441921 RepID=A0A6J0CE10_NEOLC|nr:protein Aster-B isoform X1 [Neodiprion lecontei]XP_046427743.1 protein Aster-B-like isoform X1 [Neodiprion fabricii]XP_046427744.1 protein Aster-B-like isoform X1 [Neodiprion fabricii]XP_046427745.1 protein Aster-B-like isoform X1 [Neodiprion fabricii]XP_046484674.1 protein Aster-B-like isoform X1 [Neodiprion pinetum]XP_046484676.1 protein Aster-B-like isoform X1 [Neodiprion pinetum]XP_046484677.1 protein Aster-B-like isoform X1 [Neodiprion pinetum]XP_046595993.1 protein Aster-B isoform X